MINRNQRKSLAGIAYKVAEILFAGVIISGFMQPALPYGKVVFALAIFPLPVIVGLVLESGDDSDDKPP